MGKIPEREMWKPEISAALLSAEGNGLHMVDLKIILKDSTDVPKWGKKDLVIDVLNGRKGFSDITELNLIPQDDQFGLLYMDYCLDRRSKDKRRRFKTERGVKEIKQPATYFDKAIDWQAGAENPYKAAVEEQRRAIMEHPRLLSD